MKKINKARKKIKQAGNVQLGSTSRSKGTAAVRESHLHPCRPGRSLPTWPRLGNKAQGMSSAPGERAGAAGSAPSRHPFHPGGQQKASAPVGKRAPGLPWELSGKHRGWRTPQLLPSLRPLFYSGDPSALGSGLQHPLPSHPPARGSSEKEKENPVVKHWQWMQLGTTVAMPPRGMGRVSSCLPAK